MTIVLLGAASIATGLSTVLTAALRGLLRFRGAGGIAASGRGLTALLSVLAAAVESDQSTDVFAAASFTGEAFALVLAGLAIARLPRTGLADVPRARDIGVTSGAPVAVNSILATIYNRFDLVILSALSSATQLGSYAPASRLQDMLYFIPYTIGSVSLPILARSSSQSTSADDTRLLVRRSIFVGLAVAVPTTIALVFAAPILLAVALGGEYSGATSPVRVLVFFLPLAVIQAPILAALLASDHARETTKVFALAFGLAILGHLALDPEFGAVGAAVASLSRDIGGVSLCLFLGRRYRFL